MSMWQRTRKARRVFYDAFSVAGLELRVAPDSHIPRNDVETENWELKTENWEPIHA